MVALHISLVEGRAHLWCKERRSVGVKEFRQTVDVLMIPARVNVETLRHD